MKKLVAGIIIALCGCVSIPDWVDAQQRGGDRGGGGGYNRGGGRGNYQRRYRGGQWYNDPAVGGVVGGLIGGWFAGQQRQQEPERVYIPVEPVRDVAWCIRRYKSYNPSTRTYLGYDGEFHGCP